MRARSTTPHPFARRRGSAYVLVMACSAIIAVIGVAGVLAARVQRSSLVAHTGATTSRVAAQSALEATLSSAVNTKAWRAAATGGAYAATPAGMPKLAVAASDPVDADLGNALGDVVLLRASADATHARQLASLRLSPIVTPSACTRLAICVNGNITIDKTELLARQAIHSNGRITASGGAIVGANVSAVSTITGTTFLGTLTPLAPVVPVPDASILATYIASATTITYASTGGSIDKALLSPVSNPFGAATNPQGIYHIDCGNSAFDIKDSRIVGTLIITRCSMLVLENSVCWDPAGQDLPALLADCNVDFRTKASSLSESGANRNFNTPGTPYRGTTNLTKTDILASVLGGTYFVTGNVTISSNYPTFEGRLIIGGTLSITNGRVRIRQNLAELPMTGFLDYGAFTLTPSTLQRATD